LMLMLHRYFNASGILMIEELDYRVCLQISFVRYKTKKEENV
jgi:hypothetical protein